MSRVQSEARWCCGRFWICFEGFRDEVDEIVVSIVIYSYVVFLSIVMRITDPLAYAVSPNTRNAEGSD